MQVARGNPLPQTLNYSPARITDHKWMVINNCPMKCAEHQFQKIFIKLACNCKITMFFFQCMHVVLDSSIFLGINLIPHLDPVLIIEMLKLYPYMLTPSSPSRMQDLNIKQSPAATLNTAQNI